GEKEILGGLRRALIESNDGRHLSLAVQLLADLPSNEDNLRTTQKLLQKFPNNPSVRMFHLIHAREFGELDVVERHQVKINQEIENGKLDLIRKTSPFFTLTWCDDEDLNRTAVEGTHPFSPDVPKARRAMNHTWHPSKIRVGYLSS